MKRVFAALALLAVLLSACSSPPAPKKSAPLLHHYEYKPPVQHGLRTGPAACSPDVSTSLANYLQSRPANSTVTFPHKACFTLSTTMNVQNITGLTINGNGAKLALTVPDGGYVPIVEWYNSTNIKIFDLTLDGGSYDGDRGGEFYEGDYGLLLENDVGFTFSQGAIQNVQGDWLFLSQPENTPYSPLMNTNITFSQDQFLHAGYHGITVESVGCPTFAPCNGLTITNSILTDAPIDAMDFEVDIYSTNVESNNLPDWALENYVTIKNNIFDGWGYDWFASIQGQSPGVSEQHLDIEGNTLNGNASIFEVIGTNKYAMGTATPYLNLYMTVKNNHFGTGFSAFGFAGQDSPPMHLENVSFLNMTGNYFPVCPGGTPCVQTPGLYEMQLYAVDHSTVTGNNFSGTISSVTPDGYPLAAGTTVCGNKVSTLGTSIDTAC